MEIKTTDLGKYFYVVNCWDYIMGRTIKGIKKVRLMGISYIYKEEPHCLVEFYTGFRLMTYEDRLYRTKEEAKQRLKEIKKNEDDV